MTASPCVFKLDLSQLPFPNFSEEVRVRLGEVTGDRLHEMRMSLLFREKGLQTWGRTWIDDGPTFELYAVIDDPESEEGQEYGIAFGVHLDEDGLWYQTTFFHDDKALDMEPELHVRVPGSLHANLMDSAFPLFQEFRNILASL